MDQQANQQPQQQTNIIPDDSPNPHPNGFLIPEVYYNKMQKIIDQIVENFNERNWDFQNEDDETYHEFFVSIEESLREFEDENADTPEKKLLVRCIIRWVRELDQQYLATGEVDDQAVLPQIVTPNVRTIYRDYRSDHYVLSGGKLLGGTLFNQKIKVQEPEHYHHRRYYFEVRHNTNKPNRYLVSVRFPRVGNEETHNTEVYGDEDAIEEMPVTLNSPEAVNSWIHNHPRYKPNPEFTGIGVPPITGSGYHNFQMNPQLIPKRFL